MENEAYTPGGVLSDEEYKDLVVKKYGDIPGLAKTLLYLRKNGREPAEDPAGRRDDIANYHQISLGADEARKLLNRLCLRIRYAEKNRSFQDIPYAEIKCALETICSSLCNIQERYVEPCMERQSGELMLDYLDYQIIPGKAKK
jgi:hypothetical protein